MFITPAWAQSASGAEAQEFSLIGFMLPMLLIFLVFYIFVFRPQNKRMREHQSMVDNLKRGDRVVTGGGLIGKVYKLTGEDEVIIDLGEGMRVHAVRSTLLTIREKAVSYVPSEETQGAEDADAKADGKKPAKAKKAKEEKTITVSRVRKTKKDKEGA